MKLNSFHSDLNTSEKRKNKKKNNLLNLSTFLTTTCKRITCVQIKEIEDSLSQSFEYGISFCSKQVKIVLIMMWLMEKTLKIC